MNLIDLPQDADDSLQSLLGFHRRIERQLAELARLAARLDVEDIDVPAMAMAESLLAFFGDALGLHHDDEDDVVAIVLARARKSAEHDEVCDFTQRLQSEHRQMEVTWRGLRRCLDSVAAGVRRRLPGDLVHYFRAMHAGHIAEEEIGLHRLAARFLQSSDRAAIARGMAARRRRGYPCRPVM